MMTMMMPTMTNSDDDDDDDDDDDGKDATSGISHQKGSCHSQDTYCG